ncbi:hypothetical protein PPERSA_13071 [Pseudocohnilembus persalinus]|uniref:Uncharacterized protein n=1 Tax=Pseudocohnilembus persalinus TaxID=266149 RepID=A0A0V0QX51_PSEPJ|nr:hypothetical protein PPERSA_13071 [Pseudocohnilembus persalinus]|eukprot:KRX06592.1 hypothetical protein PPERSA_13071 [Pseudocohnilembus persalinus]
MKKQLSFINKYKQQIFKFLKLLQNQELHLYQQLEKEKYNNNKNNINKEISSINEDQDYSENEIDDSENSGNYLQQHYNNQIKKQNQLNEKQSNLAQISQKFKFCKIWKWTIMTLNFYKIE